MTIPRVTDAEITGDRYGRRGLLPDRGSARWQRHRSLVYGSGPTGTTVNDVAAGLLSNGDGTGINDIAPAGTVSASTISPSGSNVIRITDDEDDDGGFELTVTQGQSVLDGSSASSVLPSSPTGTETLAAQDADLITDFIEDDDLITFGLDAGDNSNYDEGANEATSAHALLAANAAFAGDPDLIYYLTGSDDAGDGGPVGLLFVNANGSDEADSVVQLTGVSESNFDDSNII